MKLDAAFVRYLQPDDCRVLTAVEMGSKNHEVVPVQLIASIAKIRPGGVKKILSELSKHSLVSKEAGVSYEGYRLTYAGYDYLALHTFAQRNTVTHVGHQIGVGKESDIHLVEGPLENEVLEQRILKLQRLGRTSFRTVRTNRDYVGNGKMMKHSSWMYLSRRAAQKEWSFLQALHERGFPVPRPIDQSRHAIVMEWIDGIPFGQVHLDDLRGGETEVSELYATLIRLLLRLAAHGLIHGDFNEFNLLYIPQSSQLILIDFPQMVSTSHANARELFQRDVQCIVDFFTRRFNFIPQEIPDFDRDVRAGDTRLDAELSASGHLNHRSEESASEEGENEESCEDTSSASEESESEDGSSASEFENDFERELR